MPTQVPELLDEIKARFGAEPTDGIQLLTAAGLLRRPFDPGMAVLLLPDEASRAVDGSTRRTGRPRVRRWIPVALALPD